MPKNSRPPQDSSLVIGILLVLIALGIVTASRMASAEKLAPVANYGSQASVLGSDSRQDARLKQSDVPAGTKIDEYKGVAVYSNGPNFMSDHGLNYSADGYYYGYKWQCVEFVKRFYYERFQHKMPDGAGNAKYFFNPLLKQGEFNKQRGLVQYSNGGDMKPKPDDLIVFGDGAYGHVAIITEVGRDWIEVIQQNSEVPREKYHLETKDGKYFVYGSREAAGWLRMRQAERTFTGTA